MKKRIIPLLLALALVLTGCGGGSSTDTDNARLRVVTTTYPIYLFASALTRDVDGVVVERLDTGSTSCLHDYTLSVNDMKKLAHAQVIALNGAGLEDFMDDALAASDAPVIDCSEGIDLLPALGHEGHDHDTEYDPHIWMNEESAAVMMNNIVHGLGELDGAHLEQYNENGSAAIALLPGDDPRLEELACPYLITFHDGFQYFALDNGLTLLKAIEEEEGSEASAAEIKEIVALIEEYDIPAIFTEVNGSDATAQAISRETGCEVYQLDMIMSGDGTGIQPYVDAMEKNMDTILEALG